MDGVIDSLAIVTTPDVLRYHRARAVHDFAASGKGITEDELVRQMDDHGIESAIVHAPRVEGPPKWEVPVRAIKDVIDRHPGRFYGLVGFNIHEPERSLRDAVNAIDSLQFKGLHAYPHWLHQPPNSPAYEPFYSLARELNVPVAMQIGSSLRALGEGTRATMEAIQRHDLAAIKHDLTWYCHPVYLDDVCRRFPDVKVVATHSGWPWTDDLVDLSAEHPNLYICTSLHYPSMWDRSLVEFIKGPGAHKVLWGTNYPEVSWDRSLQEVQDLGLGEEISKRLLRQNAIDVFRLTGEE